MNNNSNLSYSNDIFIIPFLWVFILWFVYYLELRFDWNFNKYGIYPRNFSGLKGVFFSPFIHGDTQHLFNNSVPLFVLGTSIFYFYRKVSLKLLIYGTMITGVLTWLIGRESHHIGASGVVYLLFSFVFFSGIIKKHYRLVAMSLIIIFLYGSMIWYVFPVKEGISWEGHLSGFLVGLFFAYVYRKQGLVKEKFQFTKTAFDDMFDEDGNYIPPSIIEETEDESLPNFTYQYVYKPNKSDQE